MVVVSRARLLDRDTLDQLACNRGVRLLATCRDARFPNGERVDIGPGPTVELVESALGRAAHVLGKPNPYALTAVMGIPRGELAATLIIGDSLHQDIALANNAKRALGLAGRARYGRGQLRDRPVPEPGAAQSRRTSRISIRPAMHTKTLSGDIAGYFFTNRLHVFLMLQALLTYFWNLDA
ncbi:HAD hydrolase-like protein [Massilia sp. H-1]|nr:HAD hydrolase-like protein [Massilia sp. H-1]